MKVGTMVRAAIRKFREAIRPASARAVEELTQEIRLDTQRLLADVGGPPVATPVESNGKHKKKEDPTGSFRAFPS